MTISRISEQINGNGRPARLDDSTLEAYGKYTLPQILSEQAKRLGTAPAEALAPEANRLTVHAVLSGDHRLGLASGNGQDNAAT